MKFGTRLIHFDNAPQDPFHPMSTPIYQTATFAQTSADGFGEYDYSRSGNPTRHVLEQQLAALENGAHAFCFASGMSAITTLTHLLKAGDEILADYDLYGGTSRLFSKVTPRSGITIRYADASDPEAFTAQITPATRVLFLESPTNPFLRILDLARLAEVAHRHGVLFCVDNSVMSPYLQNPLDLGADIVLHSATKFLCGHSDVTGGVLVVRDPSLAEEIYFLQNAEGAALGPFDCFLLLRGLKTLKLRIDAQQRNAQALAEFLAEHPKVSAVYYPGLSQHPGSDIHKRQARGGGALLSFSLKSTEIARRLSGASKLLSISVSFGSVHSSICLPATMSHASVPEELKPTRQLPDNLLRLSVGIEEQEDLLCDLCSLLEAI
jgi:cystathionine beta-lyase